MLTPLGLSPSFGFGDRLGLATGGHIAAVQGTKFAPIFVQQSVRENTRTGRTPQEVMDDARRAVEAAGWQAPWGADADHLKTPADLPDFIMAGYTFYTIDPGDQVDNAAVREPISIVQSKIDPQNWDELSGLYQPGKAGMVDLEFSSEELLRAAVKYGKAVEHTTEMYRVLSDQVETFDFEISVDETDEPTTPFEHYFIANELTRRGVMFNSLAPRFIGRFEKGVDYLGSVQALDVELAKHAAVTAHFGTYKISLHSGSDKFSVYPLLVKHWGERIHVKTAGTSYLEGLRTLAVYERELFDRIWNLGLERYAVDSLTYHTSADLNKVPQVTDANVLLNDFHARQILHVSFGSALAAYGKEIKTALSKHIDAYHLNLQKHFNKHLGLLT